MFNRVASFYQFLRVHEVVILRSRLQSLCEGLALAGSIIVSAEGINGTLAGPATGIDQFITVLQQGADGIPAFTALELKFSSAGARHFDRLKIKCKKEIVTFGQCIAGPIIQAGQPVSPAQWNSLLHDPAIFLLDTRNEFEVEMGTFRGAANPKLRKFSDFATYADTQLDRQKHQKIAMFCTGGIRCEKASAYLLANGFDQVFTLQGGILKYLEEIPEAQSRWQGDCFVFDQRVALRHGLAIATEREGQTP
jgi:UPF0176 protein